MAGMWADMRRWVVPLAALIPLAACATLQNTPAQDLAWERWQECDKFPTIRLKEIRPDGQIWVWTQHGSDLAEWQKCEREARARQQRAGKLTASPSPTPRPVTSEQPTTSAATREAGQLDKTLSDRIKLARFIKDPLPGGTVLSGDLSNAPTSQREFDAEHDARVVFLYGIVHQWKRLNVQVQWHDPSGALVERFSNRDDRTSSPYVWGYYHSVMSTERMKGKPGVWKVQLWMDEALAGEYSFELISKALPPPSVVAIPAEQPALGVGDKWVQSNGIFEVAQIDGNKIEFTLGRTRRYYGLLTGELERVTVLGVTGLQFDPPYPLLKWPLRVGSRWHYQGRVDHRGMGFKGPLEDTFEVVGFEEVTTPAGAFAAFKIVSRNATYWYSPAAKTIVRLLVTHGSPVLQDFELVVFDRSERPAQEASALPSPKKIVGDKLSPEDLRPYYAESWAVVIGIDQYRHPQIPPLSYAVADARAVAAALPRMGFPQERITVLENTQATRAAIEQALYGSLASMGKDDRLFLFFAGHGVTQPIKGGVEGYLLPVDADAINLPLTALAMRDLAQIGKRLPPKHIFFALDACFSGYAVTRDVAVQAQAPPDLLALTREPVVQVLTAGTQGQRVIEEGGHGVFTKHLLKGLEGWADLQGTGLTAVKLAGYVQERVVRDSSGAQTPQYGKLDGEGEFLFRPPLAVRKEFQPVETVPQVVRVIPENGATNVPPSLKEAVIIFDQPMASGWNVTCSPRFFPDAPQGKGCHESQYWRDDRTFVMVLPSELKPNQTHSFTINEWVGTPRLSPGGGFRGLVNQKFVPAQRFFFTTGP